MRVIQQVLAAADRIPQRLGPPTEFELVTAAAFTWFATAAIRTAVVEVGLGGRLDATNVWDGGVATITNVDWDHMEYLGNTLPGIAREKAAIIKRGDRAVTAATGEPLAVIRRRSQRLGVPLEAVPPLAVISMDRAGIVVAHPDLGPLQVGLIGRHQAANAAVALGTIAALRASGVADVPVAAVRAGLAGARWPGRLELLAIDREGRAGPASTSAPRPGTTDVLLDGAHNAAGMAALVDALDELAAGLSPGRATLLLGILRDKQVATMVAALGRSVALRGASIVATQVPGTPRSLAAADLARACEAGSLASGRASERPRGR